MSLEGLRCIVRILRTLHYPSADWPTSRRSREATPPSPTHREIVERDGETGRGYMQEVMGNILKKRHEHPNVEMRSQSPTDEGRHQRSTPLAPPPLSSQPLQRSCIMFVHCGRMSHHAWALKTKKWRVGKLCISCPHFAIRKSCFSFDSTAVSCATRRGLCEGASRGMGWIR